jgi:hypothetical protein
MQAISCRLAAILVAVLTLATVWPLSANAQVDEDDEYAISLLPKDWPDLPGPPALRELARHRYETIACELEYDWRSLLSGRGTNHFLIQDSVRLMEAYSAFSQRPEVQFDAQEAHLRRMLLAWHLLQIRFESGRVNESDYHNPFESAVADAKFRLAKTVLERQQTPLAAAELERLWSDLGTRDVAHACRVQWTLRAGGPEAERFLRQRIAELPALAVGEPPDHIMCGVAVDEVFVEPNPRYLWRLPGYLETLQDWLLPFPQGLTQAIAAWREQQSTLNRRYVRAVQVLRQTNDPTRNGSE